MCAHVFVFEIVVQRKQQPRPGKKKKGSKLTSFWREMNKRTMEQEKQNIDPVWCSRQMNQVITETRA